MVRETDFLNRPFPMLIFLLLSHYWWKVHLQDSWLVTILSWFSWSFWGWFPFVLVLSSIHNKINKFFFFYVYYLFTEHGNCVYPGVHNSLTWWIKGWWTTRTRQGNKIFFMSCLYYKFFKNVIVIIYDILRNNYRIIIFLINIPSKNVS